MPGIRKQNRSDNKGKDFVKDIFASSISGQKAKRQRLLGKAARLKAELAKTEKELEDVQNIIASLEVKSDSYTEGCAELV